jgi:hypothetical protein
MIRSWITAGAIWFRKISFQCGLGLEKCVWLIKKEKKKERKRKKGTTEGQIERKKWEREKTINERVKRQSKSER